jgi:hypothetical protein
VYGRCIVTKPPIWIGVGLTLWVISFLGNTGPRSPLWFSEILLYGMMCAGLLALRQRDYRLTLPHRLAMTSYVVLVCSFGMVYETSLTVDGTGIGGVHPDTFSSFVLAIGDYLMLAVVSVVLIRRFHLDFKGVFFLAAGISLSEGLIFTGVLTAILMSAQFYAAPLFIAYYALAYASFVALPLLIIQPKSLWRAQITPQPSVPILMLTGFVLAFIVRLIWGLAYAPLVTNLLSLPENLPPL